MSEKYPRLNAKQLIQILEKKGFKLVRQSGSHAIYRHQNGLRTTIPIHGKKELGIGLLRQIIKDTDLSLEDLKQ